MISHRESPESLARLREWVRPLVGEISEPSLRALMDLVESGHAECGIVPGYRAK